MAWRQGQRCARFSIFRRFLISITEEPPLLWAQPCLIWYMTKADWTIPDFRIRTTLHTARHLDSRAGGEYSAHCPTECPIFVQDLLPRWMCSGNPAAPTVDDKLFPLSNFREILLYPTAPTKWRNVTPPHQQNIQTFKLHDQDYQEECIQVNPPHQQNVPTFRHFREFSNFMIKTTKKDMFTKQLFIVHYI